MARLDADRSTQQINLSAVSGDVGLLASRRVMAVPFLFVAGLAQPLGMVGALRVAVGGAIGFARGHIIGGGMYRIVRVMITLWVVSLSSTRC